MGDVLLLFNQSIELKKMLTKLFERRLVTPVLPKQVMAMVKCFFQGFILALLNDGYGLPLSLSCKMAAPLLTFP